MSGSRFRADFLPRAWTLQPRSNRDHPSSVRQQPLGRVLTVLVLSHLHPSVRPTATQPQPPLARILSDGLALGRPTPLQPFPNPDMDGINRHAATSQPSLVSNPRATRFRHSHPKSVILQPQPLLQPQPTAAKQTYPPQAAKVPRGRGASKSDFVRDQRRTSLMVREIGRQGFRIRVHAAIEINNLKFRALCDLVHFNRVSTILNFMTLRNRKLKV